MWIRGQFGKSLINANEIWIPPYRTGNNIPIYGNYSTHEDSCTALGSYPTEAEALRVLDMIEEKISGFAFVQLAGPDKFTGYVGNIFQMPPAGFSEEASLCKK